MSSFSQKIYGQKVLNIWLFRFCVLFFPLFCYDDFFYCTKFTRSSSDKLVQANTSTNYYRFIISIAFLRQEPASTINSHSAHFESALNLRDHKSARTFNLPSVNFALPNMIAQSFDRVHKQGSAKGVGVPFSPVNLTPIHSQRIVSRTNTSFDIFPSWTASPKSAAFPPSSYWRAGSGWKYDASLATGSWSLASESWSLASGSWSFASESDLLLPTPDHLFTCPDHLIPCPGNLLWSQLRALIRGNCFCMSFPCMVCTEYSRRRNSLFKQIQTHSNHNYETPLLNFTKLLFRSPTDSSKVFLAP